MIIKREIKKEVTEHLSKKEVTIITGARQTGKTTLLHEIKTELEQKGEQVLFYMGTSNNQKSQDHSETFLKNMLQRELSLQTVL